MSNIMFTGLGIENVYVNGKLPYSKQSGALEIQGVH